MAASPNSGHPVSPATSGLTEEQLELLKTLVVTLREVPPTMMKEIIEPKLSATVRLSSRNTKTDKCLLSQKLKCNLQADADPATCMQKYFKAGESGQYWLPKLTKKVDSLMMSSLDSWYEAMEPVLFRIADSNSTLDLINQKFQTIMSTTSDVQIVDPKIEPSNEMGVLEILGYDIPLYRKLGWKNNPVLLSHTKWFFVHEVLGYLPNTINAQNCRETAHTWGLLHTLRNHDTTTTENDETTVYPFLQHFASWDELKEHWTTFANPLTNQNRKIETFRNKWQETFDALETLKAFDNALNLAALFEFLQPDLNFEGVTTSQGIRTLMVCSPTSQSSVENSNTTSRRGVEYKQMDLTVSQAIELRASNKTLDFLREVNITICKLKTQADGVQDDDKKEVLQATLHHVAAATGIYSTRSLDEWWKQSVLRRSEYDKGDLPVVPAYLNFKRILIKLDDEDKDDTPGYTFTDEDYRNAWLNNIWEREKWDRTKLEYEINRITRQFKLPRGGNLSSESDSSSESTSSTDDSPNGFFSEQMATESDFKLRAARYALKRMHAAFESKNPLEEEDSSIITNSIERLRDTKPLGSGSYEWETKQMTLSWLQDKLEFVVENTPESRAQELDPEEAETAEHRILALKHAKESLQATLRAARWFQRGIFLCDVIVAEENGTNDLVASDPGVWTRNTSTDVPCIFGFARIIIPCLVVSRHAGGVNAGHTTTKTLVVVVVTRCEDKIKFCVCGNLDAGDTFGHWLFKSLFNEWNYQKSNPWCDQEARSTWQRFFDQFEGTPTNALKIANVWRNEKKERNVYFTNNNNDDLQIIDRGIKKLKGNLESTSLTDGQLRTLCNTVTSFLHRRHFELHTMLYHILSASHVEASTPSQSHKPDFHLEWMDEIFYAFMHTLVKHEKDLWEDDDESEVSTGKTANLISKIFNSVLVWVQHLVLSKLKYHDPSETAASNSFAVPRAGRRDLTTPLLSSQWRQTPVISISGEQFKMTAASLVVNETSFNLRGVAWPHGKVVFKLILQMVAEHFEEFHLDEERYTHPREDEAQYINDYIEKRPSDNWADIPLGPHKPRRVAMPMLYAGENSATVIPPPEKYAPSRSTSSSSSAGGKASSEAGGAASATPVSSNPSSRTSSSSSTASSSSAGGKASSGADDAAGASPASPKRGSGDDTCDRTCPVWRKV